MKHVIGLGFLALVVAAALSDGPSKASRIPCHLVAPTQSSSTESIDVWIESLRRQHNVPALEAIVFRADTILARGISGVRRSNSKEQQSQRKCSQIGYSAPDPTLQLYRLSHLTQKELQPILEKEFRTGNLPGPNYALFTDRVLVEDGRPQIYGLRARPMNEWTAGEPVLYPIEDEANVDKRRAEIGLGPLSEYREKLKHMYRPD